jgi:serine/threonine protein kinase
VDKNKEIDKLQELVTKQIERKYEVEEYTSTTSGSTPIRKKESDMETEECDIPESYTGRLEMDFTVGRVLGKGGFAHVYEVKNKVDGGTYALKVVKLPIKKKSFQRVLREVNGLRKLDQPQSHKNIVRYYGCWVDVAPTDDRRNKAPWVDMESEEAM